MNHQPEPVEAHASSDDAAVADEAPEVAHTDNPELRALITRWSTAADSPYHRTIVKKLGDRVEIADVVRTPLAAIELYVQTLEIRRTPFEIPAPEAADLTPVATSLELALPLLPPFAPPAGQLEGEEDVEHLAWTETVACPDCEAGRARCATCAGDGSIACVCGTGTVDTTVTETAECPGCHGTGQTDPRVCIPCNGGGSTQCSTCWGTGRRADRQPCDRCQNGTVVCAHCGGTGQVVGRCLKCAGLGALPQQVVKQVPCPECEGSAKVPCAECEAGTLPCEHCRASGSLVRGERVRRAISVRPTQAMSSDAMVPGVQVDPFAAAIPFVVSDAEAAGGIAARLADTPALAEEFLDVARPAIAEGSTVIGRYGTAAVVTFTAKLGTWCAGFAVVEAGTERSIECTSAMQPPVDPKAYARWIAKENAARTAAWEEADAAAEAIYRAALDQWKREVAAAEPPAAAPAVAAVAPDVAAAEAPASEGGPAPAVEPTSAATDTEPSGMWAGLRWSDGDDPLAEPAVPDGKKGGKRKKAEAKPEPPKSAKPVEQPKAAEPKATAPEPSKPAEPKATAPEPVVRLTWSEDAEARADDPNVEEPKERRTRFGLRFGRGRRDRDEAPEKEKPAASDADASPAGSEGSVAVVAPPEPPAAPAIPAPVRRDVPPPDLLPAYAELPSEVRVA